MDNTPQNMNQYFLHHQTPMNIPINTQLGLPNNQFYGFPNLFYHPNYALPQQMIYHPSSFIPPESTHLIEQNSTFISENTSQADIEKLLLETIPDLDGTEGNFGIRKFFKKFDLALQDWSEKKKIFALKSKLSGKARSYFILAIKAKHYNYKSIKNFILCQLLPSEYKVEESIDLVKKRTNSPQQKKNLKGHENNLKPQNIPTLSFKNRVNIQFEKEEFSKEILEFFEMPINQNSAKEEIVIENLQKGKLLENFVPTVENELMVEKDLNVESLEDFGKEQFCELNVEPVCSLDGNQDFTSVEVTIPAECCVFHEISSEDIPGSHEEIKEEIACFESEECFDLEKVVEDFVDLKEKVCDIGAGLKELGDDDLEVIGEGGDYRYDLEEKEIEKCVDLEELGEKDFVLEEKVEEKGILGSKLEVFEKDPEKEILPTRDKLDVLKENDNIVKEKRNVLRLKLRESRMFAKLRCELLRKEILRNYFENDMECGFLKRKIMGRFFLGVRRCLNSEKMVTLIRVPKFSKNFKKEMDRPSIA